VQSEVLAFLLGLLSGYSISSAGVALAQSPPGVTRDAPVQPSARSGPPSPRSERAAPVRLLVLDGAPEFAERVRGQVSDLELSFSVEAARPPSTHAEVEALVAERAARRDVDVIAWLGELPTGRTAEARGATVYVWIAGHERVHTRQVGPRASNTRVGEARDAQDAFSLANAAGSALLEERSATLEAAALVVRSAARAVALERAGAELDLAAALAAPAAPLARATRVPAARATPAAARAEPARPEPARPEPARPEADRGAAESDGPASHAVAWSPRAGIDWSHAGLSANGFWSARAGLDLRWGALSGGARASWGWQEPVIYRGVAFELERRSLSAEAGWALLQRPAFALRLELGAGAAWLTRTTRALAWSGDRAPARTSLSPLVTGELAAEYRLAGPFTLDVHGGVRWLSHTTRYTVDTPSGEVALAAGWHLQPNAGIALGALF
jgi:hypothetical protein